VITFVAKRLLSAIPLLFGVSLGVFALLELVPGDAARLVAGGEQATQEEVSAARDRLGLNDPFVERYVHWVGDAVQGDLGDSFTLSTSVSDALVRRIPVTASLALLSITLATVVSLTIGTLAATRPGSWFDRVVSGFAALTLALPPFVLGLLLVMAFAISRTWFPATGYARPTDDGWGQWFLHLVLPALAVSAAMIGHFTRQIRAAFVDALNQDFVRTARSKGVPWRRVVVKHAGRSAAPLIATVIGLAAGRMLGAAITVEIVFGLPGFGQLVVNAVSQRDIPVIQGAVLVTAIIVLVANLLTDVAVAWLNPRVRP
jgi:peptide/nickel transport system permease protein